MFGIAGKYTEDNAEHHANALTCIVDKDGKLTLSSIIQSAKA